MTGMPEFFESADKSVRVMQLLPNTVPRNPGEVHLLTSEVGKWRPMLDLKVTTFLDNGHAWKATCLDPTTGENRSIHRVDYGRMKVGGITLERVSQSSAILDDTKYLATCQFVLFHGQVDDLGQTITVVRGVGGQGPWATMGERTVKASSSSRHHVTGSLDFCFPGIGDLYLPSTFAVECEPDRAPCLDDHYVTRRPVEEVDLSQLPGPPLTWDLIE